MKQMKQFGIIIRTLVYFFFLCFFIYYICEFGITNLILSPDNKWRMIFNIGVWFVLFTFCLDGFFDGLNGLKRKERRNEKI